MKDNGDIIREPELDNGKHIIDWLGEMGLYANGMNGPQPLDHKEIRAWSELMKTEPTPEEVRLMRSISSEFCSWYYSSDYDTPEPMSGGITQDQINEKLSAQANARLLRVNRKPSK